MHSKLTRPCARARASTRPHHLPAAPAPAPAAPASASFSAAICATISSSLAWSIISIGRACRITPTSIDLAPDSTTSRSARIASWREEEEEEEEEEEGQNRARRFRTRARSLTFKASASEQPSRYCFSSSSSRLLLLRPTALAFQAL